MIIKENPISSQYHQIYFTFSIGTVNKIFDDIIEEYGFTSKDQEKKSKLITKMVMEKIEEELIEAELERIDRVPISSRKYRYLTEVRRDRPLLVICQFCVLSPDIPIRFPKHVPTEVFQIPYKDSILEDFANTILMKNNEFTEVEVDRATPDCIVTYDLAYVQGDFKLSEVSNLTIDLNKQEEESILFINCQKMI